MKYKSLFSAIALSLSVFILGCGPSAPADKQSEDGAMFRHMAPEMPVLPCDDVNSGVTCSHSCGIIIAAKHLITQQQYVSLTQSSTSVPLVLTSTQLQRMLSNHPCESSRLKLSVINGRVAMEVQDQPNTSGYYSQALIRGILNRTLGAQNGHPDKFTFTEGRTNSGDTLFAFKVSFIGTLDVEFYDVTNLPPPAP